jgi:glycosyltransferase involved in cell wall biosynthesis
MTAISTSRDQAADISNVINIALIAPSMDILGGQGVQADALAGALEKEGFHVEFIPINPRFPAGMAWIRRIRFLRTCVNQLFYLTSLFRLRKADVVHIFSASYWSFLLGQAPAILVASWFNKHIILNYHSGEADDHLQNWGRWVHPWLRMVDEIVVPSKYLEQVFARHGYRSTVINNMVTIANFHYRRRTFSQPVLLSVRNLESLYRIENTLQAFAKVREKKPDATLIIAGYGSQEQSLKQWVHSHNLKGVTFVGRVEPEFIPALYDSADIFLNSSVIDNQPVSILEAFAAGTPVVSTPSGDISAMVRHQETGILVPHDDAEAMSEAVLWLLENETQAAMMTVKAREEVRKYTWPCVRDEWTSLFQRASS